MVMRRWWFISGIALAATIVGAVIAVGMPKTYRASATVVVPQESGGVFLLGGTAAPQSERIALETQATIAAGNETARRTQQALQEHNKIIVDPSEIASSISAAIKPPDLIIITAQHEKAGYAKEFANQTARSFLEIMDELRQRQSTNAQGYLQTEIDSTRRDLDDLLNKKREYQRKWGVTTASGTDTSGKSPAAVPVGPENRDYRGDLNAAQADFASAQARLATLRAAEAQIQRQKIARAVVANPTYTSLLEQQNTSQMALLQLQSRYTPDHPAVEETRTRLAEIADALARTSPTMEVSLPVDPAQRSALLVERRAAEQSVAELGARVSSLQGSVAASDSRRSDLLDKEGMLEQLQDQISLKRAAYQELLTQLEAKQLAAASQRGRSAMVDSALNAVDSSPPLMRHLALLPGPGPFPRLRPGPAAGDAGRHRPPPRRPHPRHRPALPGCRPLYRGVRRPSGGAQTPPRVRRLRPSAPCAPTSTSLASALVPAPSW